MVVNCRSSGVATEEAIVSGLAPGSAAPTWMVGKSTLGRSLTGSPLYATTPKRKSPSITSVVITGRLMNSSLMICPSVTTVSPGCRPFSITASRGSVRETVTARDSTVLSLFTTKTYSPFCPRCTASAGATTAPCCSPSVSCTSTNCPGQSASSLLRKVALRRMVPVRGSTALSTKVSVPR